MSAPLKNIVLAGATGQVGEFVINELLANSFAVKVIVSADSKSDAKKVAQYDALAKRGVKVEYIDFTNASQLEAAFKGSDAFVSTLGSPAFPLQMTFAEPLKKAGVKFVIPSEFGVNGREIHVAQKLFGYKVAFIENLEKQGVPYARIISGFFTDMTFNPYLGFDVANGKAELYGDANSKVSVTHRVDVAKAIVGVLKNYTKYINATVPIQTETHTQGEIIKLIEEIAGKKLAVTYISAEKIASELETAENFFADVLKILRHVLGTSYAEVKEPSKQKELGITAPITLQTVLTEQFKK